MTLARAALLLLIAPVAACGGGSDTPRAAATRPRANPVFDRDFPDPDVLVVGATAYAYATNGDAGNVQAATSRDLAHWELGGDALPILPAWARTGDTWAPDVSTTGRGRYVLYFTAHAVKADRQCIGVAVGTRPEGPFRPVGTRPLVCPAALGGAIDPDSFVDRDGRRYLVWKNDGNCCGQHTWLWLQSTSADGTRLTGPPHRLVREDQPWEGSVVEAPTLIRHGARYVLLYSANSYAGGDYAIGYAEADRVDGPYRKAAAPLLTTAATNGAALGPGGQDVITDAGREYLVYHSWDPTVSYRSLYISPLRWRGDRPVIDAPTR